MAVILLTDGEQRSTLAATRSLGRSGHSVYVCSVGRHSLAGASRFCRGSLTVPDPLAAPAAFANAVAEGVRRRGVDLVIPTTEPAVLALAPAARDIAARIPVPLDERFRRICDKARVLAEAKDVGIATPWQFRLEDPETEPPAHLPYPVVLKPSRSVVGEGEERVKTSVRYAADRAQLDRARTDLPRDSYPVLLQQRVLGPGVGIFLLLDRDGRVLARFAHRRLREKPPSGGVSVYRESIAMPEDLFERSLALLRRFQWEGVAMVEYKVDAATGTPYVMEINGRLWGSLQLAIDAGVDFPSLLVAWAQGQPVTPVVDYRIGVRSRWWWGDVDHLIARLLRSPERLALPAGAPGRLRVVGDFLTSVGPGIREEICRPGDPWPFVRESLDWIRGR